MGAPPFVGRQQADGNSCYTGFVRHVVVDLSVNLTRFVTLDDMVHQDAFMVSAALLQEYFPHYRTEKIRLRPLEQAFLHYDYGAYRLYGKCYLGV